MASYDLSRVDTERNIDPPSIKVVLIDFQGREFVLCDHLYDRDCICVKCATKVDHVGPWQNSPNEDGS